MYFFIFIHIPQQKYQDILKYPTCAQLQQLTQQQEKQQNKNKKSIFIYFNN